MNDPTPLRVLVTGATSGLGREMAVQLGRRGCRVALTGRREPLLRDAAAAVAAAGGEPLALPGSVADPAQVRAHYAAIRDRWGGLDWAILNAGVGDASPAREFSAKTVRWMFETNVFGAAEWMEAVIPDMLKAGRGKIVGVSSLAGWRGLPQSGAYCASKSALTTLLESARVDLRGTGVEVLTVCPGFVKSEITGRNDPSDMAFLLETDDGARRILDGVERGRRLIHFPWQLSWPMTYVLPLMPVAAYDWIAAKFIRRRRKRPDPNGPKATAPAP